MGAGAAAAVVGAIAAATLQGVARASSEWPEGAGAAAQAEALCERLVPLAVENAAAYRRAVAALAGESPAATREQRDEALRRLLERSADVPARIAEATADVAELAGSLAAHGADARRPDAHASAVLAAAATQAAARLVAVNLAEGGDRPLARSARESAFRAQRAAERAAATTVG
jgi:formiminotetrahydrofolate cyclodeaminase